MQEVILGRTGLSVSVAGLGGGGFSRVGQSYGASHRESIELIHKAIDLGVKYFDTAPAYGTEDVFGLALTGKRDRVVLATKALIQRPDGSELDSPSLRNSLEASLRRLRTDAIDVFYLHAVAADQYQHVRNELLPALNELREDGLIRFIGISEAFGPDPSHVMLRRAVQDDCWDVVMVGFNIFNQSARLEILPALSKDDAGIVVMCAVRRVLADSRKTRDLVHTLVTEGYVDSESVVDQTDPLSFLVSSGNSETVVDAAYRFARHQTGCHVVLTGTGSTSHLYENSRSINGEPLPSEAVHSLERMFQRVDHVSGA